MHNAIMLTLFIAMNPSFFFKFIAALGGFKIFKLNTL